MIRVGDKVSFRKFPSGNEAYWRESYAEWVGRVLLATEVRPKYSFVRGVNYGDPSIVVPTESLTKENGKPFYIVRDSDGISVTMDLPYNEALFIRAGDSDVRDSDVLCLRGNPYCCGVIEVGGFSTYCEKKCRLLFQKAFQISTNQRKGIMRATTTENQETPIKIMGELGFKLRSKFRNPNTNNIVSEWEHRSFNKECDVPLEA